MEINPYLMFSGNCEEALRFYEQALGAKIESLMKNEGSPMQGQMPPDWSDKVMHARFSIDNHILMASDAPPGHYSKPQGFSVSISLADTTKGEEIFNKLAEGGSVQMPFGQTFWASGFGMCIDRFGIPWFVNCE